MKKNIMATTEKATALINDLIEINNVRVAGFEKALEDIDGENPNSKNFRG